MANKGVFASTRGRLLPKTDVQNEAGGTAYDMGDEHGLAQLAATGCFGHTFYATADVQLEKVLKIAEGCSSDFIARTAVYARKQSFMKDMPALLCAVLAARKDPLLNLAFPLVMDNARMLRNFVQIVRSGVTGRKSLGSGPRRLVRQWLVGRNFHRLFRDSVGQDPSIADVIKMVHPKPQTKVQTNLFKYLIGKPLLHEEKAMLPSLVVDYENYKLHMREGTRYQDLAVPEVPFQMLTALGLGTKEWTEIAQNAPWQMTRMNLNTFKRHKVFDDPAMVKLVADRLKNYELVHSSRCFPYQLFMAFHATRDVPHEVSEALQDALDASLDNVPAIEGQVYVFPDVSGSMSSPVTGGRKGSTTKVTNRMVAGLVASALLRTNPKTVIVPFDGVAHDAIRFNPRDSVMTNADILGKWNGGSTNLSAPLNLLNAKGLTGDLVVYVSDNQSWVDSNGYYGGTYARAAYGSGSHGATGTMQAWEHFKRKSPNAKMVCIDISPYTSTQAKERDDIFNVGGFSDSVFRFLGAVAKGQASKGFWVDQIKKVELSNVGSGQEAGEGTDSPRGSG